MKRSVIAAALALALAAPMAAPIAYADPPGRSDHNDQGQQGQRGRWDQGQHNGYKYNGKWHYGPPPQAYQDRPGFEPGYQPWRKGQRLPVYYRSHYSEVDCDQVRLHKRHGYKCVRDERGDALLIAISTGLIAAIIAGSH
jgi:Ni/Co efflux regulator RcnB